MDNLERKGGLNKRKLKGISAAINEHIRKNNNCKIFLQLRNDLNKSLRTNYINFLN